MVGTTWNAKSLRSCGTYRQLRSDATILALALGNALWRDQGNGKRATVAPIYGWFTEGFDTLDPSRLRRCSVSSAPDNEFRNGLSGWARLIWNALTA